MASKLLTDASFKTRDKKKEATDFKAGKRKDPGFVDLTPVLATAKVGK